MCASSADEARWAVARRIGRAGSLLLVTHARPDGDGLGSICAVGRCAQARGIPARLLVPDEVPRRYRSLFAEGPPAQAGQFAHLADGAELVVVMDTCAYAQLDGLRGHLEARRDKIVVIDHHVTGDDLAAMQWVDTTAAATGVMVHELLAEMYWPVGPRAARDLLVAIVSDTGWLRFSNTDARTLRCAADLLDAGARPDELFAALYQRDRPQRLRLLERMLGSLELHHGERLAVMALRDRDFREIGATEGETENLINESLRLETVQAAVLLVENAQAVRVSLRSRGDVNVARVAEQFGGGGHARAAGCRVDENLDKLKDRLVAALGAALASGGKETVR